MKMRSLLGIGALVLAGSVAAACGGDGGDADGSGGSSGGSGGSSGGSGGSSGGSGGSSGGSGGSSGGSGGSSGGSGGNTDGGTNSGGNAGEGGMGGMGGDGNCVSDLPTITVADPFSANDFDDVDLVPECPNLLATASWPIEANDGMTQFTLDFLNSADVDFTGKQVNLTISLVEDVRGASATGGGYDIVLGATDADDYTEVTTPFNDNEFYSTGTLDISFAIPDDNNDFDATNVYKAFVRIVSKHWGTGDPVFDYETATFEISEFSISDAP